MSPICALKVKTAVASAQARSGARFMASPKTARMETSAKMTSAMSGL